MWHNKNKKGGSFMTDRSSKFIKLVKEIVHETEKTMIQHDSLPNYIVCPYDDDEYYELNLLNDGSDLLFRFYYEDVESDSSVTIELCNDAFESVVLQFSFLDWDVNVEAFEEAVRTLIMYYTTKNWYNVMSEIHSIGIDSFLEKCR